MRVRSIRLLGGALAALLSSTVLGGCAIILDMTSTPEVVAPFEPVEFEVKITNDLACPVEKVVTLIFPFIEQDRMLDEVDQGGREDLDELLDAFCSGEPIDPFLTQPGSCRLDDGDIVCDLAFGQPRVGLATDGETMVLPGLGTEDGIACSNSGDSISCRIPEDLLESAVDTASAAATTSAPPVLPALCASRERIGFCFVGRMPAGQMRLGRVELIPDTSGMKRNWAISFALKSAGVCSNSTDACNSSSDCDGGTCQPGMCVGGPNVGMGCTGPEGCDGFDCTPCRGMQTPGELLGGLACTETAVTGDGVMAPAMSTRFLAMMLLGLLGLGIAGARRRQA